MNRPTNDKIVSGDTAIAIARDIIWPDDECSQCGHRLRDFERFYSTDFGNYCSVRCAEQHYEFLDTATD